MKKIIRMTSLGLMCMTLVVTVYGQKFDQERMDRDIEVAENVLGTLLRQNATRSRSTYLFSEVNGSYTPGYGVIFSIPFNDLSWSILGGTTTRVDGIGVSRSYSIGRNGAVVVSPTPTDEVSVLSKKDEEKLLKKVEAQRDSARDAMKAAYIDAMKTFLADYGDLISQIKDNEKIMVTNRPTGFSNYFRQYQTKRTLLVAEVSKADLNQKRQGQISRDQLLGKIKITNTESTDEIKTDLELFSSILSRLYRQDLSKTYFASGDIYYEQLVDYGVVYYMVVYSSNRGEGDRHSMPTLEMSSLSQEERNQKVIELYPEFEKSIKDDLVEYGKTIRSLKPEEMLVLNVKLTACKGCGIPSTVELSVKMSVLQDYAAGKISKESAVGSVNVTQGAKQ